MSEKILIVDDDQELLRLIGYALNRAGYQPIAAQNAEAAFRKVQEEDPALVILDVLLPGQSGIEFCKQLRSRAKTLPLPIIMLSARTQVDDKIEGLEAGADEYLTKPISPKEMVARVTALLDRTRRLRQAAVSRHGKALGFVGAKGGVGTTTVALNVSLALVQQDRKTVAAELRPNFGSFPVHLGFTVDDSMQDLSSLRDSRPSKQVLRRHLMTDHSGLEILFGPSKSSDRLTMDPAWVEDVVAQLSDMAEFVVLDLPTDLDEAAEAALMACELVTLVTRPEPDSLAAAKRKLNVMRSWGIGGGMLEAVIVNHVPLAVGVSVDEIGDRLECEIAAVIPPAADAFAVAQRRGRPLLLAQPKHAAVTRLTQLAEKLVEKE